MKKTLLCLLSALIAVSAVMGGCSKQEKPSAGEHQTLRVEIFDRGDVPAGGGTITDNAMTQWAQENFGDPNNITLEYVSVPRAQELEQLNVLMAAKQAPDIVFSYSYGPMYNFCKDGGITDVTELMNEHGSDLKTFLGDEVLKLGQIDGKQYLIPAKRIIRGTMAQLIRQDWLDALGLEAPTTTDELYTVLKAFKEKDPGKVGDKLIPYALSGPTYTQYRDLLTSFIDTEGMDEAEVLATDERMRPGFKEGLRFLNKLYNEGLISPDFSLDKDRKQMETAIANGYVGFFNDDLGRPLQIDGVYDTLKKTVPTAKLAAVDTFTDKNGNHPKAIYSANGLYLGIPSFSKSADAAVKYLNWMSNKDVMFTLQYGIEGRNYQLDESGFPVTLDTEEAKTTHWYNLGFDMALVVNGKYIEDDEKSIEFNAMSTGDNKDLYLACYENSVRDGWSDVIVPPTEAENKYASNYYEKAAELCNKSIMASTEEFDSVFDGLMKEMRELGGEEMIAARLEVFKELLKK